MRVTYGCTRLVILTETRAIKIAIPFEPLLPLFSAIRAVREGKFLLKMKKYQGRVLREIARQATTSGIQCNRQEIRLSQKYPDCRLIAPVLKWYLAGLVVVMPRGQALHEYPPGWFWFREMVPKSIPENDFFAEHNLAQFGTEVRSIDYGGLYAEQILEYFVGATQKVA